MSDEPVSGTSTRPCVSRTVKIGPGWYDHGSTPDGLGLYCTTPDRRFPSNAALRIGYLENSILTASAVLLTRNSTIGDSRITPRDGSNSPNFVPRKVVNSIGRKRRDQ